MQSAITHFITLLTALLHNLMPFTSSKLASSILFPKKVSNNKFKIQALCDHASIHNLNQIDNMIPTIHASIPYQHLNHLLAAAVEYCWY